VKLKEELAEMRRLLAQKKARPPFKPMPLEVGVTNEDDVDLMYENIPLFGRRNPKKTKKRGDEDVSRR